MKQIIMPVVFTAIAIPNVAVAALDLKLDPTNTECTRTTIGLSQDECQAQCTRRTQYCCPICYTASGTQTCPPNWTLGTDLLSGNPICTRTDNTIVSNDTKGYKKQNYGSCSPTISAGKVYRYEISNTAKTTSAGIYYCEVCS